MASKIVALAKHHSVSSDCFPPLQFVISEKLQTVAFSECKPEFSGPSRVLVSKALELESSRVMNSSLQQSNS